MTQKSCFFKAHLAFLDQYPQFGMCSIETNHIWNLGTWNLPFSVISNLRPILLIFWLPKNDYSHKSAIFSWKKPKWSKKDKNMYKVYRKYKKNGFQNTLKMAKMCSLRGTVPQSLVIFARHNKETNHKVKSLHLMYLLSPQGKRAKVKNDRPRDDSICSLW